MNPSMSLQVNLPLSIPRVPRGRGEKAGTYIIPPRRNPDGSRAAASESQKESEPENMPPLEQQDPPLPKPYRHPLLSSIPTPLMAMDENNAQPNSHEDKKEQEWEQTPWSTESRSRPPQFHVQQSRGLSECPPCPQTHNDRITNEK